MAETPRLQAKLKFVKWSASPSWPYPSGLEWGRPWATEQYTIRIVIPVETGIQALSLRRQGTRNIWNWIPVFTGNPGFLLAQEWRAWNDNG